VHQVGNYYIDDLDCLRWEKNYS